MKKLLIIVFMIAFSASYAQNTNIRANTIKAKYENVFYKSPQKFNNKEQVFKVTKISFHTSYKGSNSKNTYQISIDGFVNNKKEQVLHNAKSIDELEYFKNLFKGRFKKVLLFENSYKVGSKTYHDTSIVAEF